MALSPINGPKPLEGSPGQSPQIKYTTDKSSFGSLHTEKATSDAVRSDLSTPEDRHVRTATQATLSSSLILTAQKDIVDKMQDTADQVIEVTQKLKNENNPTKRAEYEQEVSSLIQNLEEQYNQAVEDNPQIAQNTRITAIVDPGEDVDEQKTFTLSTNGVDSPAGYGLQSDYSLARGDEEETIEKFQDAQSALRTVAAEIDSSTTRVSAEVEKKRVEFQATTEALASGEFEKTLADLEKSIRESVPVEEQQLAADQLTATTVTALVMDQEEAASNEDEIEATVPQNEPQELQDDQQVPKGTSSQLEESTPAAGARTVQT